MRNVFKRDGTWWVRVNVPASLQAEWGKTAEWRSLKTTDELEAIALAPAVIREVKERIAALRAGGAFAVAPTARSLQNAAPPVRLSPDQVRKRIIAWRDRKQNDALLLAYNGELPILSEAEQRHCTAMMDALVTEPEAVAGFSQQHAEVLGVPMGHPVLRHSAEFFATCWLEAEWTIENFRHGRWERWEPIPTDDPRPVAEPTSQSPPPSVSLKVLLDRFVASQAPAEEEDVRYVWRRFVEFVGDLESSSVTPQQAEAWVLAIKAFPVTRKPAVVAKDIKAILAEHGSANVLSPKTAWKWAGTVNRVFAYAQRMKVVSDNPMAAAMPRKPGRTEQKKRRRSYTAAEIASIFAKPLFQGSAGAGGAGYREQSGDRVVKDAKYWLPIFALWHGCRMEEIGGAKLAELKVVDGITHFDWLDRDLKTPDSSRLLPIHPHMTTLGFLDYVRDQKSAGQIFIFPDLQATQTV